MSNTELFDIYVDAIGLNCPLPILRARKAILSMQKGQILKVSATDKTSQDDFPVFAEQLGYELIDSNEIDGVFYYFIKI